MESKLAVGTWTYTELGDPGLYVLGERRVFSDAADPRRSVSVFGRVGIADEAATVVDRYLGAGVAWRGIERGREIDEIGFGIAGARLATGSRDEEVAFELYYRARVTRWLTVQPLAMYVAGPGVVPGLDDATVLGLRVIASF